jgi:hypothetical protein
MKVSRKVGRCKGASSISRRRLRNKKSGSKKKHTQRGGKYGKRGRGHKRARTYKRGKRFHRGGVLRVINDATGIKNGFLNGKYKITYDNGSEVDVSLGPYDTNCVVVFKVKKEGTFSTKEPQQFYCTLTFTFNKQNLDTPVKYSFALQRKDDSNIKFAVAGKEKMTPSILPDNATSQQIIAEKLKSKNFLEKMTYFKGNSADNRIIYDFSDPNNLPIFSALADIIMDNAYIIKAKKFIKDNPSPKEEAKAMADFVAKYDANIAAQKVAIKTTYIPDAISQIKQLKDDSFEVQPYNMGESLNFGSFKRTLILFATQQKQEINSNSSFDDAQRKNFKSQIDELLKLLLFAQFMGMKILKINEYVTEKLKSSYILDFEVSRILETMEKLTEDTKTFITKLVAGEEQSDAFDMLKNRLENFAKKCNTIKENEELTNNTDSNDLDAERKAQLVKDVDELSQTSEPATIIGQGENPQDYNDNDPKLPSHSPQLQQQ